MTVKGLAIDMDGTVYKGNTPIPGAIDFIHQLKEEKIPFVFITNNSSKGRAEYFKKLKSMGFDIEMDNVLTSGTATLMFLSENRKGKTVYVVGTKSYVDDVVDYGIKIDDEDPDIVLLSFDRELTYEKINKSYAFIKGGAEFIATHPDNLCPKEDGYDVDIGAFIAMYKRVVDADPLIIGKPNRFLLDMAASAMKLDVSEIAMVGDRLSTDIKMAQDCGIDSVLVLTGEAKIDDLKGSEYKPTYIADSLAEIFGTVFKKRTKSPKGVF